MKRLFRRQLRLTRSDADYTPVLIFMIVWGLLFFLASVLLGGCTSMTAQQEAQAQAQIAGTYTKGQGCRELNVATGQAAVAAAKVGTIEYVEVKKPE